MILVGAAVAGVLGLMFLVNAFVHIRKDRRERATWGSAGGVVVGHAERPLPRGAPIFRPLVKFTTDKGAVVQFEDHVGHKPPRHKMGQLVRVLYDRAAPPQTARIVAGTSWAVAAPFFTFGLLFLLLSAVLVWVSRQP